VGDDIVSKYDPLHVRLVEVARTGEDSVQLGFDEMDTLVGGLPASARTYREWWANSSQPHCWAWREAGWVVAMVSDTGVRFERDRRIPPESSAAPIGGSGPRSAAIDPKTLPAVRVTEVHISVEWRDAGVIALDVDGEVLFPALPREPGLYEMTFAGGRGQARSRVYVGETDDLRRRATHYRNPGPTQETNRRLNAAIKAYLTDGGVVRLAIATEARVTSQVGATAQALDLTRKASRLLAESAAMVLAQLAGAVEMENLE
jgi:hypothetical protein